MRNIEQKILHSRSYKKAMDDVKNGRVYKAKDVEDLFRQITEEKRKLGKEK